MAVGLAQNADMPNIATVLKAEVARLARKELRASTEGFKKAIASQRSEIAGLKRQLVDLQKSLKALAKAGGVSPATAKAGDHSAKEADATGLRFRAAGMASNRKRLGLSAEDFGLLVGATGQSVYAWEQGKSKPRAQSLAAIAALRDAGKREVYAKLEAIKATRS